MIQPGDSGRCELSPARAMGLGGIIEKSGKSRVRCKFESLGTLVGTVEPEDSSIRKQNTLNHTTSLGHRVHFPSRVSILWGDDTTAGVSGGRRILVRTTTADYNLSTVLRSAAQWKQDTTAGVRVSPEGSREIRHGLDDGIGVNTEDLRRLRSEDKHVSILEKMNEGVHLINVSAP